MRVARPMPSTHPPLSGLADLGHLCRQRRTELGIPHQGSLLPRLRDGMISAAALCILSPNAFQDGQREVLGSAGRE